MMRAHSTALCATASALLAACAQGVVDGDDPPEPSARIISIERVHVGMGSAAPTDVEASALPPWSAPQEPTELEEDFACSEIVDNYHAHGLDLGCATTTHICPDMLRFAFGQACLLYQAATVDDCRERIFAATTCQELWGVSCNVAPVPSSAPLGCPDM